MRILMTGAAGKVGTLLRPRLAREGRVLRLSDLRPLDPAPGPGEEEVPADLADPAAMAAAMKGVDAVLHLGGQSREHPWADIVRANMDGTHVLLEAAREEGVRHVVMMGSHHAAGFHTRPAGGADLPDYAFPRPDTYYGVSKVVMEALGSLYHDRFGMNVTVVRLGTCNEGSGDTRGLATWISPGDLARLVEAAFTAPGFHVVWGVSDNTRRWWSLDEARAIGYVSEDDSESHAAPLLAEQGEPDLAEPLHDRAGGVFTLKELGGKW
ncbi:NAD-dependent epimerase/dehydratase family protein [Nonomuraea roseoviolacea]|uniref:Nucleoside-diphosphate-sugar epimerase n=1 Tax=Nonomuraea roseoviolacea subsp. carminata TaxID=160689 RepID=A0ABT1JT62_9ACTN|nr:NAD(P)-dependent oxidoreductase [Nonomuraea roseoviolacea]MCP2344933.1 nucleoside-diphosphate-sugar epimerase [Nonomuraea roseoviolacea subsp. carminata]